MFLAFEEIWKALPSFVVMVIGALLYNQDNKIFKVIGIILIVLVMINNILYSLFEAPMVFDRIVR